jgi:Domain of unknown function (DUF1929)/Glyoxal oxidase N-terminus
MRNDSANDSKYPSDNSRLDARRRALKRLAAAAGSGASLLGASNRLAAATVEPPAGASTAGVAPPPAGGAIAPHPATGGRFDPVVNWPLIPIHQLLLPDGRVMSYGTDEKGRQGSRFIYDIWTPSLGTGPESHMVLPNTTPTDIFCGAQVVVPSEGKVLLTGGDNTINGVRNYSSADINEFDYQNNTLSPVPSKLSRPRWYPTILTLPNSEVLVMGGRATPLTYAIIPEVYTPGQGWRKLTSASNDGAYGILNWYYPKAFVAPNGKVFITSWMGRTYYLDPQDKGRIVATPLSLPFGHYTHPSVMFEPGKILAMRGKSLRVIDLLGERPSAKALPSLPQERFWSSLTVMADGQVLLSGGSGEANTERQVNYQAAIWNPQTGLWTPGAMASKMRLYHSASMLLPDGRVLTGGGGAPGPVDNLNAEIYSPPYLFTATGALAKRPVLAEVPAYVSWGSVFSARVQADGGVSKVTLVHSGSVTHTVDFNQRCVALSFEQRGDTVSLAAPVSGHVAPPGFYMLFVFDKQGVPSVAKMIRLGD